MIDPYFPGLEDGRPRPILNAMTKTKATAAPPASDPLAHLLQAHPETVFDYFEFRRVMAGNAAALAAERATEADLARLGACVQAMEQAHALDDPAHESQADADFHLAIYEAAHNLVMSQVMHRDSCVGRVVDHALFYSKRGLCA